MSDRRGPPGAGAAQVTLLGLVERAGPVDDGLARLVLTTPATGRGRVDLPLDTHDVPVDELQRVATGVLARLVDRWAPPPDDPARVRTRFRARRFRVHGSPVTAGSVRDTLTSAGLVEGDYRTTHLVVALPLELMVREHWVRQVAGGSGRSWRRLWRMLELADRLPPRVDVPALARRLARERARFVVVVGGTPADAVARAASVLGVRPTPLVRPDADPVVVDLRRRLNLLRGGRTPDPLDDWCAPAAGPALAAPAARLPWLTRRGDDLARRLRDADYPVHGDPAEAARLLGGEVRRGVDPAATLDMTVHAIRAGWQSLRAEVS